MQIEHELKFFSPQREELLTKIEALGGKQLKPKHLLRRCVFYIPETECSSFVRVRDEGDYVTLTYKQHSSSFVYELEEKVESFDTTVELLRHMKLIYASYQENYRESYLLNSVLITFDTWPGIPTFLEIEAPDNQQLLETVQALGLNVEEGIVGHVNEIYQRAGINILDLPEITFQSIPGKKKGKG